ncbi:MAG: MBL fold metallo-hydrolase, partial [Halobacteriales archaeon]|nr:MBL fold metallo-hydrolase [Halobacteriales archaeon]
MAERIATGVWLLDLGWFPPLGANAYLVDDGELTLVDTGLPFNARRVRDEVEATGYRIRDIDRVLVTHYDLDHVGGLSRLVPDLDAPVYLGTSDYHLLAGEWDPPWLHHKGLFHRAARWVYRLPIDLEYRPVDDGEQIGGYTAHHTPGHNPGHTAYLHEDLGVGLLGDLVWEEEGRLTTPVWLDSYDMGLLRESVRRLAEEGRPFEIACMGHGQPIRTGGHDALR